MSQLEPVRARPDPELEPVDSDWRDDWRFRPGWRARLAPLLDNWERLRDRPATQVVKENLARTVLFTEITSASGKTGRLGSTQALVVKQYRSRRWAEALKYTLCPSRAEREGNALVLLARCGVSVPRVFGWGPTRRGLVVWEEGLVMEKLAAEPLPQWLGEHSGRERSQVLEGVGHLIARMHASGCYHPDLHAGNLLATRDGQLSLIDLHAARVGAEVPEAGRVWNLGRLYHSLGRSISAGEMRACLEAYLDADSTLKKTPQSLLAQLEFEAERFERIRLASRSKRCWKQSSEFERERRLGGRTHRRRELEETELEEALAPFDPGRDRVLKERPRQRVFKRTLESGRSVVIKRRQPRPIRGLFDSIRPLDPLARAWAAGRALEVRRIATPRTLAYWRRSSLTRPESVLVTEWIDVEPLRNFLARRFFPTGDRRDLRRLVRKLARFVAEFHRTGLYHRDLNPMNLLTDGDVFWLIDLDSMSRRSLTRTRRLRNLGQLGLVPEGHIRTKEWLTFLSIYDEGSKRFWNRETIDELRRELEREILRVIVRFSRQEYEQGPSGDPIFETEKHEPTPRDPHPPA